MIQEAVTYRSKEQVLFDLAKAMGFSADMLPRSQRLVSMEPKMAGSGPFGEAA